MSGGAGAAGGRGLAPDGQFMLGGPVGRAGPAGSGLDRSDGDPGWHARPGGEVLEALTSGEGGLGEAEAAARRPAPQRAGRRVPHWLAELGESLVEPLQLLLVAVGVLSAVFGEVSDAVAIFVVIGAVVVIETVTEMRAGRAINALKELSAPTARVLRAGAPVEVPAADLVSGDVLVVEAGDRVPADARVLAATGLRVDESTLTGEGLPVGKGPDPVGGAAPLAERTSILYAGTAVLAGAGRAVVTAAGGDSELGRLGRLVAQESEPPTPLQRALRELARAVLVAAVAASVLVPAVGVLAGRGVREMLLAGLTLAFATVPEELPILVTVLLAVGGRQLASRGALLRRLRAGEALGAVTVVLTDKTGTLTANQLHLVDLLGDPRRVLGTALACLDPHPGAASREPIDAELARAAAGLDLPAPGEPAGAFPFDPATKTITRLWRTPPGRPGPYLVATTGAPEAVLARCTLDEAKRVELMRELELLTGRGLRVVGFASRTADRAPAGRAEAEQQLSFAGLAAFADPIRPGVLAAVDELRQAGVATLMVTGDHPVTAAAVAAQAGLTPGRVLLGGAELAAHGDTELQPQIGDGTVVARATPADKLRLVRLLQARGEIVAVTGDGVNDAPALAAADVGIAMGRRGSDLARDAAGVVLTDDAYPTVAAAVRTGRNVAAQLRRAVAFYLGAKIALVITMLIPLAMGRPAPFAPVHIVLLELFMDLGASVAFVAEPPAPDAMTRPPRPPGARFLDRAERAAILTVAAALTLATLPAYLLLQPTFGEQAARAAAVLGWLAGHTLIAWSLRARPRLGWQTNPAFPVWALTATAVGLLAALTPAGRLIHLSEVPTGTLPLVAGLILAATALAALTSRLLRLNQRL